MKNFNGTIQENEQFISAENRGLNYGDALFETMKYASGKLLFWEDHYFRLMASMRIMRMEIPMNFTMEFLEDEILKTLEANALKDDTARIKLLVYREEGGYYTPESNDVGFVISTNKLENTEYHLNTGHYEVDLFKDYYVSPSLLSTLKSNNKALHVVGSIYAKENGLNNCLILNTDKQIVEALNGNLFLVKDKTIKTPPLADGCLKGVMRQQILELGKSLEDFTIEEASISPFELQKADELFITNVITGIQPISQYRKKTFSSTIGEKLIINLNEKILA
ncbi:aminotransferase class IV [Gaetbulibacter aestuarii]|uniref:branched-chain-amino-acid transaminase n=1 Tax=Gaetbulibacter aestuarii TaxID=1502358 RepID=A0ABW7MYZ5_9FLAO